MTNIYVADSDTKTSYKNYSYNDTMRTHSRPMESEVLE
jgi:hypothetical protein